MSADPPQAAQSAAPDAAPNAAALLQACRSLLKPLAELAIARGLHHADLDELLRAAFIDAALAAHPDVPATRAVSRVSAATGLNRREVSRLMQTVPTAEARRSPATQVFTRWVSDPTVLPGDAFLASLPRQGPAPSFESLAQSVTKDVHPRTLLEELCRLGLTRVDQATDRVELLRDRFAPAGDEPRMLGFLASNVGDHLRAATANVLADAPPHLEQALFADELSRSSVHQLQPLVREQWQQLLRTLAPAVQNLIDDDKAQQRVQDQRLRIGLYAYSEAMAPPTAPEPAATHATPARPRSSA